MLSSATQPFERRYEHFSIGSVLVLIRQQEKDVSSADLVGGRKTDGAWKASLCGPYIVSRHGPRNAHMRRNAVAPKTGQMRQARVRLASGSRQARVRLASCSPQCRRIDASDMSIFASVATYLIRGNTSGMSHSHAHDGLAGAVDADGRPVRAPNAGSAGRR